MEFHLSFHIITFCLHFCSFIRKHAFKYLPQLICARQTFSVYYNVLSKFLLTVTCVTGLLMML